MLVAIPDTVVCESPRLALVVAASARAEGAQVYCVTEHHGPEAHGMLGSGVLYIAADQAIDLRTSAYWLERPCGFRGR